jgi:hypothetical protein
MSWWSRLWHPVDPEPKDEPKAPDGPRPGTIEPEAPETKPQRPSMIADARTSQEIARVALLISPILAELGAAAKPGMRTGDLERAAADLLARAGLASRMLHYNGSRA